MKPPSLAPALWAGLRTLVGPHHSNSNHKDGENNCYHFLNTY